MSSVYTTDFQVRGDARGSLVALQSNEEIPFEIRRVYYIFGTNPGVSRGCHAHRTLSQVLVAVHGSVEIHWEYRDRKGTTFLSRPEQGLVIEGLVWREMRSFSPDCVLMVVANALYEPSEYIRDYQVFLQENERSMAFIHPSADVQTRTVGRESRIWQNCVVLPQAKIGAHCNICCNCFIENNVIIGNHVTLKCGVCLWDGMVVEDNVFIGPNVCFCNDRYPKSGNRHFVCEGNRIRQGASIGANATVLPGVCIGENAMIGAGALVTKDVPAGLVVKGIY